MERTKLFNNNRTKLFSTPESTTKRIKLFGEPEVIEETKIEEITKEDNKESREVICMDCGFKMETTSTTTDLICPKCGGTRFDINEEVDKDFQNYYETPDNEVEEKLKEYSGKTITEEDYEKLFSDIDLGNYAETSNEGIKVDENAYLFSKLFSSISITITKELDLDPNIVCGPKCDRESIINGLEESESVSPKCIMLIRKAHNISNENRDREWVNDSGIVNDLGAEFNGQSKDVPEFKKILDTRYPDAPENIMDILNNSGVIKLENGRVTVL